MRHFKQLSPRRTPLPATEDPTMQKLDLLGPIFEQDPEMAMELLGTVMNKEDGSTAAE